MGVTLQNADEVYEFYRGHRQNPWKAKAMYGWLAVRHRPAVHYEDGARASLRVLAKDELFDDPDQRRKIDDLGGIPVFRPKDHGLRATAGAAAQMIDVRSSCSPAPSTSARRRRRGPRRSPGTSPHVCRQS